MPRNPRSAFTLIELLIVIAIIAVIAVVVILVINPAEVLRQARDSNRLSDLATLTQTMGIFSTDVLNGNLGAASTLYVSIPDPTATSTAGDQCQGLSLPTLPSTWTYHCASQSAYKNVDGTGWLPANLASISSRSPIGALPVDPTNNVSSRLYYTYATDGTRFEVTSPMESQKYKVGGSNDVISTDGGPLASVYEKGTKLGLVPMDYGDSSLVGLWTLDEGSGSTVYDYSGSNATGSWQGTGSPHWAAGKVGPYAGQFNATSSGDQVVIPSFPSLTQGTVAAWAYFNNGPTNEQHIVDVQNIQDYTAGANWYVTGGGGLTYAPPSFQGAWHHYVYTFSPSGMSIYFDGNIKNTNSVVLSTSGKVVIGDYYGGTGYTANGLIDDVRVYNRVLSAAEIQAMYNGSK